MQEMQLKDILMKKIDIERLSICSSFYKQILQYWFEAYSKAPSTIKDVLSAPLWFNNLIQIGQKLVFYKSWSENGINILKDILNDDGVILSRNDLEIKFNINIDQMQYNSLTHAIPKDWLKLIKGKNLEIKLLPIDYVTLHNKTVHISEITCKDLYKHFIHEIKKTPKAQKKWEQYLQTDQIEWEELYKIPFKVTRETFIQSFQYKIFHRFFPCNYTLAVWYKDKPETCMGCGSVDYPEHYFYDCSLISPFWLLVKKWLHSVLEITIPFSMTDVLFGISNPSDDVMFDILNFCFIYGKWFIYQCKQSEQQICLPNFILLLKQKLVQEKLAHELGKQSIYQDKLYLLDEVI